MKKDTLVLRDGDTVQYARKDAKTTKATAKAQPVGSLMAFTNDHGAKRFFPAMGAGAVVLAESMGLTATLDKTARTVLVSGSKADFRKFEKAVDTAWKTAWVTFRDWKAANREHRADQWLTSDGKRAMYLEESNLLENAVAGQAVL